MYINLSKILDIKIFFDMRMLKQGGLKCDMMIIDLLTMPESHEKHNLCILKRDVYKILTKSDV